MQQLFKMPQCTWLLFHLQTQVLCCPGTLEAFGGKTRRCCCCVCCTLCQGPQCPCGASEGSSWTLSRGLCPLVCQKMRPSPFQQSLDVDDFSSNKFQPFTSVVLRTCQIHHTLVTNAFEEYCAQANSSVMSFPWVQCSSVEAREVTKEVFFISDSPISNVLVSDTAEVGSGGWGCLGSRNVLAELAESLEFILVGPVCAIGAC